MDKKNNLRKKIGLGFIYVLAVFGALTIVVMLIPSGENTRNAYKSDFIKPMEDIISDLGVDKGTNKYDCLSRLGTEVGNINDVKDIRDVEYSGFKYLVGTVVVNNKERQYVCSIDKDTNKVFSIMLDENILAVKEVKNEPEYQFGMDAFM